MSDSDLGELLRGVRIVDCTRNIAGAVATMLAAEMGADVIKVEPPDGDEMWQWPPFVDGESVYFASRNRGKRSIVIDFKDIAGKQLLHRLLAGADVVVENYRPGTLERMGLGWTDLHARYPSLVWVSVKRPRPQRTARQRARLLRLGQHHDRVAGARAERPRRAARSIAHGVRARLHARLPAEHAGRQPATRAHGVGDDGDVPHGRVRGR